MSELNAEQIREAAHTTSHYRSLLGVNLGSIGTDAVMLCEKTALIYASLLEAQVEGRALVIVKENGEWPEWAQMAMDECYAAWADDLGPGHLNDAMLAALSKGSQ